MLKRRPKDRLGSKNGIIDIKEHAWFKNVDWVELYRKETKAQFIPKAGDNFDTNYCNRVDEVDHRTYDYYLNKVNTEKHFADFYYNVNDLNSDKTTILFEYEGKSYKFVNIHEEKYDKNEKEKDKKSSQLTSLASTNVPNFGKIDSTILSQRGDKNENTSISLSHRKMNF